MKATQILLPLQSTGGGAHVHRFHILYIQPWCEKVHVCENCTHLDYRLYTCFLSRVVSRTVTSTCLSSIWSRVNTNYWPDCHETSYGYLRSPEAQYYWFWWPSDLSACATIRPKPFTCTQEVSKSNGQIGNQSSKHIHDSQRTAHKMFHFLTTSVDTNR